MESVKIEDEERTTKKEYDNFNVHRYRKQMFSMYSGSTMKVNLICENKIKNSIWDRFGDCVKLRTVDTEHFRVTVEVQVIQRYKGISEQNLKERLNRLLEQEQELNALKVNRLIELSEYRAEMDEIKREILALKNEIEKSKARKIAKSEYKQITGFDGNKVERFIEKVTIHPGIVTFTFTNGVNLSRPYSNGQPGNQTGWLDKKRKREEGKADGNR